MVYEDDNLLIKGNLFDCFSCGGTQVESLVKGVNLFLESSNGGSIGLNQEFVGDEATENVSLEGVEVFLVGLLGDFVPDGVVLIDTIEDVLDGLNVLSIVQIEFQRLVSA